MSSAVPERLLELAEQLSLRADVPAFGLRGTLIVE